VILINDNQPSNKTRVEKNATNAK